MHTLVYITFIIKNINPTKCITHSLFPLWIFERLSEKMVPQMVLEDIELVAEKIFLGLEMPIVP